MSSLVNREFPVNSPDIDLALERQAMEHIRIAAQDFTCERRCVEPQCLFLTGELDAGTAVLGRRQLRAALQTGRGPLILNCSSVEFIDAAWLGVLVSISNYGARIGRQVVIGAPSPRVVRLLRLVGLQWLAASE